MNARPDRAELPLSAGRPRRLGLRLALVLALALGLGLASGPVATAQAETSAAPAPGSVKAEALLAQQALARAVTQIRARKFTQARASLGVVRTHSTKANAKAKSLIGAPPTDPESDDVPGPPAVLAALKMDNQLSTGVGALFNGHKGTLLVRALRSTVTTVQTGRDTVVNKVVGLPPEGAGADYADSLSDSLGMFTREVTFFTTGLNTYDLSAPGRAAMTDALARAKATKAKMDRAFGGGERPATPSR